MRAPATSECPLTPTRAHPSFAGGLPLEFPVLSTGETLMRPTAMLYRNLMAMDTEEMIRANPIDGGEGMFGRVVRAP